VSSSTDDKNTHKSDSKEKEDIEKHHHKNKMAQKTSKRKSSQYSDISLNDKGISWMDMNHSVVIVGWGKDEKTDTRYWIVRNSYGPKWGMDGDFLVKRGNNDFGMEVE
jgi:C1A family cysteine protease